MATSLDASPTPARAVVATIVVLVTVLAIWKVIDYRTQPPLPRAAGAIANP